MTETYAERRAAMADQTRTRILEACVEILARGVAELSIPAVAREAGVSVPTVYRHFPDKKKLLHETALHLKQLRGPIPAPPSLDAFPDYLSEMFVQSASISETVRAALASEHVLSAKKELGEIDDRLGRIEAMLGPALGGMSAHDRELAILVTTVLCSSATARAFRDVANASPERAAEAVSWAVGRILGRSISGKRRARKETST